MLPSTSVPTHYCLNLQEERLMVVIRPHVEEIDSSTTPFYVTLVIHNLLLHSWMLESRASHNLMPLAMMEKHGLQIKRPYKYLYFFESKRVKCLGMIKDMVVNLAQIPMKSVVMEIVVADIPPRFNMLLSRSQGSKVGDISDQIKLVPLFPLLEVKKGGCIESLDLQKL